MNYMQVLAQAVGANKTVVASRFHSKRLFFLATETTTQEAVEKGLTVGHVPLKPLEELES